MKKNYTLYVKTHRRTGLKYLGQTRQNAFTYKGSGKDWVAHLIEYGNDVHTEIILQTEKWAELTNMGRYYSNYYNIVNAVDDFGNKIWANRIRETGGGSCENVALSWKIEKTRNARVDGLKKKWSDPTFKEEQSIRIKSGLNSEIGKTNLKNARRSESSISQVKSLNTDVNIIEKRNKTLKIMWENETHKKLCVRGSEHYAYNSTLYEFEHKDGRTEKSTLHDLTAKYSLNRGNVTSVVQGNRNSCSGWSLKKVAY